MHLLGNGDTKSHTKTQELNPTFRYQLQYQPKLFKPNLILKIATFPFSYCKLKWKKKKKLNSFYIIHFKQLLYHITYFINSICLQVLIYPQPTIICLYMPKYIRNNKNITETFVPFHPHILMVAFTLPYERDNGKLKNVQHVFFFAISCSKHHLAIAA